MAIEDYYDQTGTLKRWDETYTEGSPDYSEDNFDTQGSTFPCARQQVKTTERMLSMRETWVQPNIIYCDPDDVTPLVDDRILIGSDWYDVVDVNNPMTMSHHYEVLTDLVQ